SRLESLKQKKQAVAREGSSVAHKKYYDSLDTDSDTTLYSSSLDKTEEGANETDDADESDMDLSDDNLHGDDDAAEYRVFMHNKSTATPNYTYLSLTVTSSSLDFIQTFLDETPTNELTDFMSHPEMFPDENAHHLSSPPATKTSYPTTTPQSSSLQAKAKKLMQKAKNNMRNINFKKAVAQKFREYDQKLEALTNFNQALDAQDAEPSFHNRSHNNQDSPNNHNTPVMQPLDQEDEYIRKHPYPEWFPKKSGLAKRRTTWFDILLKSDIDQNENHILGPSTVAIAKKLKEII
ncbi:hypothetical protein Tco_0949132, partial [Tanacetum coccineum]